MRFRARAVVLATAILSMTALVAASCSDADQTERASTRVGSDKGESSEPDRSSNDEGQDSAAPTGGSEGDEVGGSPEGSDKTGSDDAPADTKLDPSAGSPEFCDAIQRAAEVIRSTPESRENVEQYLDLAAELEAAAPPELKDQMAVWAESYNAAARKVKDGRTTFQAAYDEEVTNNAAYRLATRDLGDWAQANCSIEAGD